MRLASAVGAPDQPLRREPGHEIDIEAFSDLPRINVVTSKTIGISKWIQNEIVSLETVPLPHAS